SEKMVFSNHNLIHDASFNEFHLVICRNVLIYFDPQLQSKVLNLLSDSLRNGGYMALGKGENPRYMGNANQFKEVDSNEKIYKHKLNES
ncbi:MAG: protein-glutamate O-methyltransferase CheR, partial [Flavobacteriales bacterium]|nr:protein-glutamate O-methyltransferase CheR [Flavobacteriales bacterium]